MSANAASRKLYVYVPGIGRDRSARFLELLKQEAADESTRTGTATTVLKFTHRPTPLSWRGGRHPWDAAESLDAFIARNAGISADDVAEATEIVLVAHSLGGLIARSAWLAVSTPVTSGERVW